MPCRRAGCGVFGKSFDVRFVDLPVKVGLIKVGLNSYSAALQRLVQGGVSYSYSPVEKMRAFEPIKGV